MSFIKEFILVGAGGFFGAATRYGIYVLFSLYLNHSFPLATLTVNALGSFLIGLLAVIIEGDNHLKLFLIVGILGGFTTFSSFSHETMKMFDNNQILPAAFNIFLNITLCLICVYMGYKSARILQALSLSQ